MQEVRIHYSVGVTFVGLGAGESSNIWHRCFLLSHVFANVGFCCHKFGGLYVFALLSVGFRAKAVSTNIFETKINRKQQKRTDSNAETYTGEHIWLRKPTLEKTCDCRKQQCRILQLFAAPSPTKVPPTESCIRTSWILYYIILYKII